MPARCRPPSCSPQVPLAAEVTLYTPLPKPLPGHKPHPGGHNVVYSSCLSTKAWGGEGLPQGSCAPEAAVVPVQLPRCISYLLPLFSLSLLVLFGGCWAGSPTGMLWGNYAVRVTAGCCPGEHVGMGSGGCLSVRHMR